MSLLKFLQFQPIDPASDLDEIPPEHQVRQEIDLKKDVDGASLETFWNQVEHDIHEDPEWFNFSDK